MSKKPNLVVTDFADIKQSIINKFQNDPNSPFKDYSFEGSSLSYLIDILSYVTQYNNYYSHVAINELYLPYAQRAKNIYALARSLGYLPKRPTSSYAFVSMKLPKLSNPDTTRDIVIPTYTTLKSKKGMNYILMEDVTFRYNSTINDWQPIRNDIYEGDDPYLYKIKQGNFISMNYMPTLLPRQRILIENFNIDNAHDSIIIQDSVTNKYWKPFYDISDFDLDSTTNSVFSRTTTVDELKDEIVINESWDKFILDMDTAEIFFIDGDENGSYISFGDDILGKIPENPLVLYYIVTEGEKGNGDTTFTLNGTLSYVKTDLSTGVVGLKNVIVTIDDNTSSVGGSSAETAESIRRLAPSFYNSQNRAVTEKDYEVHLMQQRSVPLKNIKAIGGENLTPIVMGGVGICANKYSESIEGSLLDDSEKAIIKLLLKNKNIVTINPIFINPEFVSVNIKSKIYYNPAVTEDYSVYSDAKFIIEKYLENITGFKKYFKYSNLVQYLDDKDTIDHNLTEADLEYTRIIEKKNIIESMYVNFGNKNTIMRHSIDKNKKKSEFIKVFNKNTFYDDDNILPPTGTHSFDIADYSNKIHKIFLYDLVEECDADEEYGRLYLVEKYVKTIKAKRIDGSNSAPFFFEYVEVIETGKKKLIGNIHYGIGLIKLFFDNSSFRYLDINKKSVNLALETTLSYNTVFIGSEKQINMNIVDLDSISNAYKDYDSLFFTEYPFNTMTNIPTDESGDPIVPINNDKYVFNFAFDTENEDFQSMGNIIISKGDLIIERYSEVNKS